MTLSQMRARRLNAIEVPRCRSGGSISGRGRDGLVEMVESISTALAPRGRLASSCS